MAFNSFTSALQIYSRFGGIPELRIYILSDKVAEKTLILIDYLNS